MRHILAELTIFIEGVPDNFAMIGKVLNVATGLLPLQKNEDGTFGTASYTKEECDIPLRIAVPGETLKTETLRLMPTANGFHTTKLFIQLISPGGVVSNYDIEAPVMKSGGKYKINLEFEEMKPYMYLTSTKIDDWTEEWIYRGEILNPEDYAPLSFTQESKQEYKHIIVKDNEKENLSLYPDGNGFDIGQLF